MKRNGEQRLVLEQLIVLSYLWHYILLTSQRWIKTSEDSGKDTLICGFSISFTLLDLWRDEAVEQPVVILGRRDIWFTEELEVVQPLEIWLNWLLSQCSVIHSTRTGILLACKGRVCSSVRPRCSALRLEVNTESHPHRLPMPQDFFLLSVLLLS